MARAPCSKIAKPAAPAEAGARPETIPTHRPARRGTSRLQLVHIVVTSRILSAPALRYDARTPRHGRMLEHPRGRQAWRIVRVRAASGPDPAAFASDRGQEDAGLQAAAGQRREADEATQA